MVMPKRGEVEEFIWVLAIALILIVAVGIFSFFFPYTGPLTNITIDSFRPGEVGFVSNFVARSTDLRTFTVGEEQTENLESFPLLEMATSIFGGNVETFHVDVPDYFMETARGIRLDFSVAETNNYGNLVVKWNGRELLSDALRQGVHEIFIDKEHVKGSNTLEVSATGPGFLFWAATVYNIKNFNVNLEYGPERVVPFMMLPSEMEKFEKAEITTYAQGTGTLVIKVNGAPVYSDTPQGALKEEFTLFDAPIRSGQNVLTFVDGSGTYTLRDTIFRVYITGDQSVASHTFNLTEENFNFLANSIFQGRVEYRIENINRKGSIEIEVNGRQLSTPTPRVGWNSASFTADMVHVGDNLITFTGTGSFEVSEVLVGLER
jgi:hypothetical protein